MEKAGSWEHLIVKIAQCAQILRAEKKKNIGGLIELCALRQKSLMQLVMIVKLLWIVNRESTWCSANEKFDFAPSDNTGTTYMTQLIKVKTFRKWKKKLS